MSFYNILDCEFLVVLAFFKKDKVYIQGRMYKSYIYVRRSRLRATKLKGSKTHFRTYMGTLCYRSFCSYTLSYMYMVAKLENLQYYKGEE
jgi:hypothetical protein